ncbi:MAG: Ig-like domain repeat protein [Acidobacteriaceae bacterium]
MVIESAAYFRRLARTAAWFLIGAMSLCGVAAAQTPPAVTTGSVIPLPHNVLNQVYRIAYWQGNILILDTAASQIFQISPGSTTLTEIASGAPMGANGSYWTMDMVLDNEGNMYLDERYGTSSANGLFFRVPYNPTTQSWALSTNDGWGQNIEDSSGNSQLGNGSDCMAFLDSGKGDGSGTLFWMSELSPVTIWKQAVSSSGQPSGPAVSVITGIKTNQGHMTVDTNGNIIFVDGGGNTRVNGVFFIPAGSTGLSGEASATNLIPSTENANYAFGGVALDPAGNLYLSSAVGTNNATLNGVLRVPNTCGTSQSAITGASCYDFDAASYVSPVGANQPVTFDPRGYLWIPAYGAWSYPGSSTYGGAENAKTNYCTGGACNFVVWAMGSDNLGSSAVATASATGTVFVNFNAAETLGGIGFSQPGTGSDFATTATNPYANATSTSPTVACTAGTQYTPMTSCPVWVAMTPRTAGAISGEINLTDSSKKAISGSTTYLSGTGQGALAAFLGIPQQTAMAAGLSTPAQVAVDSVGNVYVADPGLGKVLAFAPGSSAASATWKWSGTAPTGVAVDGSGDLYIGDSGKIIEVPFVNGALDTAAQSTLVTSDVAKSATGQELPLGNHLSLAVDGAGNVYVADADNSQVVKIENPQTAVSQTAYTVVGSGFTAPSAAAADSSGNVYVADGSTLYEITPWSGQTVLDTTLSSPVKGLVVEPSGSVDVAQKGGILRIPSLAGSFTVNDAVAVDTVLTDPQGVALDNQGNLYVADMTGGTPNLFELNTTTDALYDFGQVGAFVPTELDVSAYDVGNEPLAFSPAPTFSGTDSGDFSLTTPTLTGCPTDGTTTIGSGASCAFGVAFDPLGTGTRTASMAVTSAAANGTITANFTANSLLTLEPTAMTFSLNPTASVFPGSTTALVTITQAPVSGNSTTTNVPDGKVTVTLVSTTNPDQPAMVFTGAATGTDASTSASIPLTALPGGTYNVKALYVGNANYGGAYANTTFVVTQAAPSIVSTEPSGITPDQFNGSYYVKAQSNTTITATVSSTLGAPTGTVTFMNPATGQPADPAQVNEPLDANGQVTFNLQNLAVGSYSLTAVYSGDSNFAGATSAAVSFQVLPTAGAVLITASPAAVSASAGTPVSSTLTLESLVGFSAPGGVNITCDNTTLPQYSECTFNNPQPDIAAGGTTTTVVTISSNVPVNVGSLREQASPFALAGVFGLGLLGLGLRKRRLIGKGMFHIVCLTLLLAGSIAGFTGCTNSGYTHTPPAPHDVTPSGTYNVSIIVTDEASGQQYSVPFTLGLTMK